MKEYSIMPPDELWELERFDGSHRHEVFGAFNRQRSIRDGLVIFLTAEMHNMSHKGIHYDTDFMEYAQKIGQATWMKHYNKTEEEFIAEYRTKLF